MLRRSESHNTRSVTDPNHEPVRVVDQVSFHAPLGLDVNLTLCTFVDLPSGHDGFEPAAVVTARLRMKVGMARALIDGLARQVAMAEAAGGTMN